MDDYDDERTVTQEIIPGGRIVKVMDNIINNRFVRFVKVLLNNGSLIIVKLPGLDDER